MLRFLYNRLNLPEVPSPATQTRIIRYVNETLEDLVSEPGMSAWLLRAVPALHLTTEANLEYSSIPYAISRVTAVCDRTTNLKLSMMSVDEWRRRAPNPALTTGTPTHWVPLGMQAATRPPASPSGLWVVSTLNSDVTQIVSVEALRSFNLPPGEAMTAPLSGTAFIQVGTSLDFVSVSRFELDAPTDGYVVLWDTPNFTGHQLATIPAGQTQARVNGIAFYPTPSGAFTYYFDGDLDPAPLARLMDEPLLPPQFHRLLTDGALWREYDTTDDDRAPVARKKYEHGVSQLRYYLTCPPDYLPTRGRSGAERSRLGGFYPDGAGIR